MPVEFFMKTRYPDYQNKEFIPEKIWYYHRTWESEECFNDFRKLHKMKNET